MKEYLEMLIELTKRDIVLTMAELEGLKMKLVSYEMQLMQEKK